MLRRALLLSLVLVLVLAGSAASWCAASGGVHTISAGRVYQSGALDDDDLEELVRREGIHTVIDLRAGGRRVRREGRVLARLGVEHAHLPSEQVPEDGVVEDFLDLMERPSAYPVLIHCRHGEGRSMLFAALYRIEFEGWPNEVARRATRCPLRLPWSSFDDEEEKGDYLLHYAPRLAGRGVGGGARDAARVVAR